MITKQHVLNLLDIYKTAWEQQDPKQVLKIFTEDAEYYERVFEKPFVGHAQIEKYWVEKVVKLQSNIQFSLLNLYQDGNVAIAEWEAIFDDLNQSKRKHMKEVAILEFKNNKICHLREYWSSIIIS